MDFKHALEVLAAHATQGGALAYSASFLKDHPELENQHPDTETALKASAAHAEEANEATQHAAEAAGLGPDAFLQTKVRNPWTGEKQTVYNYEVPQLKAQWAEEARTAPWTGTAGTFDKINKGLAKVATLGSTLVAPQLKPLLEAFGPQHDTTARPMQGGSGRGKKKTSAMAAVFAKLNPDDAPDSEEEEGDKDDAVPRWVTEGAVLTEDHRRELANAFFTAQNPVGALLDNSAGAAAAAMFAVPTGIHPPRPLRPFKGDAAPPIDLTGEEERGAEVEPEFLSDGEEETFPAAAASAPSHRRSGRRRQEPDYFGRSEADLAAAGYDPDTFSAAVHGIDPYVRDLPDRTAEEDDARNAEENAKDAAVLSVWRAPEDDFDVVDPDNVDQVDRERAVQRDPQLLHDIQEADDEFDVDQFHDANRLFTAIQRHPKYLALAAAHAVGTKAAQQLLQDVRRPQAPDPLLLLADGIETAPAPALLAIQDAAAAEDNGDDSAEEDDEDAPRRFKHEAAEALVPQQEQEARDADRNMLIQKARPTGEYVDAPARRGEADYDTPQNRLETRAARGIVKVQEDRAMAAPSHDRYDSKKTQLERHSKELARDHWNYIGEDLYELAYRAFPPGGANNLHRVKSADQPRFLEFLDTLAAIDRLDAEYKRLTDEFEAQKQAEKEERRERKRRKQERKRQKEEEERNKRPRLEDAHGKGMTLHGGGLTPAQRAQKRQIEQELLQVHLEKRAFNRANPTKHPRCPEYRAFDARAAKLEDTLRFLQNMEDADEVSLDDTPGVPKTSHPSVRPMWYYADRGPGAATPPFPPALDDDGYEFEDGEQEDVTADAREEYDSDVDPRELGYRPGGGAQSHPSHPPPLSLEQLRAKYLRLARLVIALTERLEADQSNDRLYERIVDLQRQTEEAHAAYTAMRDADAHADAAPSPPSHPPQPPQPPPPPPPGGGAESHPRAGQKRTRGAGLARTLRGGAFEGWTMEQLQDELSRLSALEQQAGKILEKYMLMHRIFRDHIDIHTDDEFITQRTKIQNLCDAMDAVEEAIEARELALAAQAAQEGAAPEDPPPPPDRGPGGGAQSHPPPRLAGQKRTHGGSLHGGMLNPRAQRALETVMRERPHSILPLTSAVPVLRDPHMEALLGMRDTVRRRLELAQNRAAASDAVADAEAGERAELAGQLRAVEARLQADHSLAPSMAEDIRQSRARQANPLAPPERFPHGGALSLTRTLHGGTRTGQRVAPTRTQVQDGNPDDSIESIRRRLQQEAQRAQEETDRTGLVFTGNTLPPDQVRIMLQALRARQAGDSLVFEDPAKTGDLLRETAADLCTPAPGMDAPGDDPSDDGDDDDDGYDDEDEDEEEGDFDEDDGPAPPPFDEESSPLDFNDLPPESPPHDDSDDKDYQPPPDIRIPTRKRPRGTRDTQAPDRFNPDRYATPADALPRGVTGHRPDHSGEAELSDSDDRPFRELPKLRRSNTKKAEVGRMLHQLLFRRH